MPRKTRRSTRPPAGRRDSGDGSSGCGRGKDLRPESDNGDEDGTTSSDPNCATVQHSQETDLCAEMFGVGRDLEQGLGSGVEQQVVEDLLVDQRQMREMMRHREDDVDIRDR